MMKKILFVILVSLIFASLVFSEGMTKEEEAFLLAEKAFNDGFYDASIDIFNSFLKEFPDSGRTAQVNLYIGKCYLYQNKINEALNKLLEQISYGAGDSRDELYYLTAEAYFRKKDYKEAEDYYSRILKEFPLSKYITDYLNFYLGEANFYQDKFETALDFYNKALALSQDAKAKNIFSLNLGWVNVKLKKYSQAKAILEQIPFAELDKRSQEVFLLGKATLFSQESNFQDALAIFENLISESEDGDVLTQAYLGKADCFFGLARYEESVSTYEEILSGPDAQDMDKKFLERAYSGLTQARFFLGANYANEGNIDQALIEYNKVLSLGDSNMLSQANLAMAKIYKDQNRYDEAIKYFQSALLNGAEKEDQPYLAFQIAECYQEQAQSDEAIKQYQKIAHLCNEDNPLFVKALLRIAQIYEHKEQLKEAKNIYKRIMAYNIKEASYAKEKYVALSEHISYGARY